MVIFHYSTIIRLMSIHKIQTAAEIQNFFLFFRTGSYLQDDHTNFSDIHSFICISFVRYEIIYLKRSHTFGNISKIQINERIGKI